MCALYNTADIASNERPQTGPGTPVHSSDFQAGCNRTPRCVVLHRLTRQTTRRGRLTVMTDQPPRRLFVIASPFRSFTDFLPFDTLRPGRPIFPRACRSRALLFLFSPIPRTSFPFSGLSINRKQPRQWNLGVRSEGRRRWRITSLRSSPGCFRGGICEWAGNRSENIIPAGSTPKSSAG